MCNQLQIRCSCWLSAERIQIDVTKLRQDHRVLELAGGRVACSGERDSPGVADHTRPRPADRGVRTGNLASFARLEIALVITIEKHDDVVGDWHQVSVARAPGRMQTGCR